MNYKLFFKNLVLHIIKKLVQINKMFIQRMFRQEMFQSPIQKTNRNSTKESLQRVNRQDNEVIICI